jgi:glycosyltransferase involved in cell wall biosynthesis
VEHYADFDTIIKKKSCINNAVPQILWVGRFIDLKHPEVAVHVAKELQKQGNPFNLIMVGDGPIRSKIQTLIADEELHDYVKIVGSKSPSNVRTLMEESDIFLFTSDKNEGWGAVLNESMNAGCVVIANYSIGSVPFLINDGVNGYHYKNNDLGYIVNLINLVIKDSNLQRSIAIEANRTISARWDAKTAVYNLLHLIDSINTNTRLSIVDGPCSKA